MSDVDGDPRMGKAYGILDVKACGVVVLGSHVRLLVSRSIRGSDVGMLFLGVACVGIRGGSWGRVECDGGWKRPGKKSQTATGRI